MSISTFDFELPFNYKNHFFNAEATIMKVHNHLNQPMIRVSLNNHPKTPDVYIFYMLDIDSLFTYNPELPKHHARYFEFEEKAMISGLVKRLLIDRLKLLGLRYDDWKE